MKNRPVLVLLIAVLISVSSLGCAVCSLLSQERAQAQVVPPPPTNTPKPTFTVTPTYTPRPPATPTPIPTPTPETTPTTATMTSSSASCSSPDAAFVADVTVPDGTQFSPGESFGKTWRLRNDGDCPWGEGYKLVFVSGAQMGAPASQAVPDTPPGGTADITVSMVAPAQGGTYVGKWRMMDANGNRFGTLVFVQIVVPGAEPAPAEQPAPAPPPEPAPEPEQHQFTGRVAEWHPNCGLAAVGKSQIVDVDTGAPVNGVRIRIWNDGGFEAFSLVSGVGATYGPGEYDIVLNNHPIEGTFYLAVWDWQTGPDEYTRVDSETITVHFDIANCQPGGDGHQVAIVNWARHW